MDRSPKISVSFRLDAAILDKLSQEAQKEEVSVNSLVNRFLKQAVEWHVNSPKAGMIFLRKPLIKFLLDNTEKNDIVKLGKILAKETSKDFVFLFKNKFDALTTVELIKTWVQVSGFPFSYKEGKNKITFFLEHDLGEKYSLYIESLFSGLFDQLQLENKFDKTNNGLWFSIKLDQLQYTSDSK